MTSGYSFGGIDSFALPSMRIQGARLQAGVADYGVVVLPGLTGMRLEALEKLAQFCRQGGTVIATKRLPETAYGWKGRAENTAKLRVLVREMFGDIQGKAVSQNAYGKGQAIFVNDQTATFPEGAPGPRCSRTSCSSRTTRTSHSSTAGARARTSIS